MTSKIITTTRENLQEIIQLEIKMKGNSCNLNHIDFSNVTDMSCMFQKSQFNGDISNWNVSNVSNVKNMNGMFYKSKFNGDLTNWLPYNLLDDENAFEDCTASRPYWANFDNLNNMRQQIDSYLLYCKLNSKLNSKENSNKKHKKI